MHNEAHGGWSSLVELPVIDYVFGKYAHVDLWILDYMINDIFEKPAFKVPLSDEKETRLQKNFVLGESGTPGGDQPVVMAMAIEKMIQTFHRREPQSHIMMLSCGAPFCYDSDVRRNQTALIKYYNLMYGDIADAFHDIPQMWDQHHGVGLNHPGWPTHQYIADAISAHLEKALKRVSSQRSTKSAVLYDTWPKSPYWPQTHLDALCPCCDSGHLTTYDARTSSNVASAPSGKNWNLEEDVKGKPGWISQTPGAHLTFDVKFGKRPTLELSYLRSYEGLGSAQVFVHTTSGIQSLGTLNGLWDDASFKYTSVVQPFTAYPNVPANSVGRVDIVLQPGTTTKMKFTNFGTC